MSNETTQRKSRTARPFWSREKDDNPHSGGGGSESGNEFRKGCAVAATCAICVPLLILFAFLALAMTLARVIPEFNEWTLR